MPDISPFWFLGLTGTAAVLSLVALWIIGATSRRAGRIAGGDDPAGDGAAHFLFEGDVLMDDDARLASSPGGQGTGLENWTDLRLWLNGRFDALPDTLAALPEGQALHFASRQPGDSASVTITRQRGICRVVLEDPARPDAATLHDTWLGNHIRDRSIAVLQDAPCAISLSDPDGGVIWKNALFEQFSDTEAEQLHEAAAQMPAPGRVSLGQTESRHFEIRKSRIGEAEALYASDITKVVHAERVRREFVQTLTKTFANLTTGLAVFDRNRQLALFNPALVDLTELPAVFLSGRPSLTEFFDHLRNHKILPEPKNYKGWRAKIDAMTETASDGLYLEDWCLPNGLTYRVTGRPHPDGAIAFLFEDISDEVTLTRRFRSQLDLRQAVFDTLDKAVTVIGPNNVIVMCNRRANELLSIDPDSSFADMSVDDFIAACTKTLPDTTFWNEARAAIMARKNLEHILHGDDGVTFRCRITSLPGKSAMVAMMALPVIDMPHQAQLTV